MKTAVRTVGLIVGSSVMVGACGNVGDFRLGADGGLSDVETFDAGSPQVEIGTSPDGESFLSLVPGVAVPLEPGGQGGFHVPIHVRINAAARAVLGERSPFNRRARRVADDRLVSVGVPFTIEWLPEGEGRFIMDAAVNLFLCPTPVGVEVADQLLEVQVELGEEGETVLTATQRLTPECPPGGQEVFCNEICRG